MEFEFNPEKSAANLKKHGLSLKEAQRLWEVPTLVVRARVVGEERWMIIGWLGRKCYSCIFTIRAGTVRLISARRSHPREEQIYDEKFEKEDPSRGV